VAQSTTNTNNANSEKKPKSQPNPFKPINPYDMPETDSIFGHFLQNCDAVLCSLTIMIFVVLFLVAYLFRHDLMDGEFWDNN
jgi:hypothetical protein